jgi:predicted permease
MWQLWHNLRYTIRILGKNPGFTTVAVLSLALGIGANTAIFTLVNALLLRDLPVRQPERLVELSASRPDSKVPFSYPMFREVEHGQRVFSDLVGWSSAKFNVEMSGVPSRSNVLAVTGNYYDALGVAPLRGRLLSLGDVDPHAGSTFMVAVIGYDFWQQRFAGAPDVVGKQIRVEGQAFTIVGVSQKWFTGMTPGELPDVTIPITAYPLVQGGTFSLDDRSVLWVFVTGRLKDGVNLVQARSQLLSFWSGALEATASTKTPGLRRQRFLSMRLEVTSVPTGVAVDLRSQFSQPLYVLSGIVGLILLVACVNLANLMLARAAARGHEMSVRVAIGASRGALVGQALTESLVLSVAGAVLGLTFSYWGSRFLVILMTDGSVSLDLRPDVRVLSVTLSVGLFTGILFGLAPAWSSSRQDPASVLQQSTRSLAGGAGKLSKTLIVMQVVLSLVLLLGAGLLVRSFQRLRTIDLGFDRDRLLEVMLNPRPGGYQNLNINSYHKQLIERISNIPGVRSASFADLSVPSPQAWRDAVSAKSTDALTGASVRTSEEMVSPGFFATLGIRLIRGRDFAETDDDRHARVGIVSRSLAERLFPNGDAIGKSVRFGVMPEFQDIQIVGIASDARILDLRDAAPPVIYVSYLQYPKWAQWGNLFIRANESPEVLAKTIGREIDSLGHEYALRTRTIEETMSYMLVKERVMALLSGFFAALALLLACVGLYGLMSYGVTRRTREIGVRVALGAQSGRVLRMVLGETLALVLLGIAIGIPCALAASRLIASMLFELSSNDSLTIVAVSLLLLAVALFAGYLPARKASTIEPIVALRME